MSVRRGERLTLSPTALSDMGDGVAWLDGVEVRVPGAAPGDDVAAIVEHVSRHEPLAWARLTETTVEGPLRVRPPCHHAAPLRGACGGCPLMHLKGDAADGVRAERMRAALAAHGFDLNVVRHAAPAALGWRNRSRYLAWAGTDGRLILGSRARRGTRLAPMGGCRVVRGAVDSAAMAVAAVAQAEGLPADGPKTPGLRWLSVRANTAGEVLVELITRSNVSWGVLDRVGSRLVGVEGIVGVVASVSDADGNAIAGEGARTLAGATEIVETVGDVALTLSHDAFFQLNTEVAAAMYARAAEAVPDGAVVWDIYAGVGGLGIVAGRGRAAHLHGVEVVEKAVDAARRNATAAGVDATYHVCDLRDGLPEGLPAPDVMLVNPPRRGIDEAVRARLATLERGVIVYMSCDPSSFARDARALVDAGWVLDALDAWEMMPQTPHLELLGVFRRG